LILIGQIFFVFKPDSYSLCFWLVGMGLQLCYFPQYGTAMTRNTCSPITAFSCRGLYLLADGGRFTSLLKLSDHNIYVGIVCLKSIRDLKDFKMIL